MNTVPYAYQLRGARQLHRMGGKALVSWEMGVGKSLLSLLYAYRHPTETKPTIVVCPASLKWNWEKESKTHLGLRGEVLEGTKPPKGGFQLKDPLVIINYDILWPWMEYLKNLEPKLVIADEAHYISNRQTKRSKGMKLLCKDVPHVIALTGTPLSNRPAELWNILNLIRPEMFPSWFSYAMHFCAPKRVPWGGGWDFSGASNIDELHHLLIDGNGNGQSGVMIRLRKEDVLKELPSKQRSVLPLTLPHRREYDEALRDFLGWLAKKDLGKARRAAKAQTLVRLGYLKRLAGTLKLPLVIEWVDDFLSNSDGKLVLFAIHQNIVKSLQRKYEGKCVVVDGRASSRERHQSVEQFQKEKGTRIFIGNIKAAGVGLNLTAASTVAFAELDWVPANHIQAEDRCHRIGTKSAVSVYYLVGKDTIETNLVEIIQSKQKTSSAILDGKGKGDSLDVYDILCKELLKEQRSQRKK